MIHRKNGFFYVIALPPFVQVIVSTDVMARGVDLDRVNVVANLDLPMDAATYVHRYIPSVGSYLRPQIARA